MNDFASEIGIHLISLAFSPPYKISFEYFLSTPQGIISRLVFLFSLGQKGVERKERVTCFAVLSFYYHGGLYLPSQYSLT